MKLYATLIENTRALLVAMALSAVVLGLAPSAHADVGLPENWWVYVHNDKAADIKALLAKGADPNVRYKNGQPALMRAVIDGAWNVFDILAADPRTDVNAVNPANETALMYLAVAGETDRAHTLIKRGAQVNRLGWTPLHYAASKGHLDMAKLLIANRAMVNAPSPEGTTPIMMAGFSGEMAMVQLLLQARADITTRNLKGQNAADWAYSIKRGKLGAALTDLIAKAERQRDAQRAGQGGAKGLPIGDNVSTPLEPAQVLQVVQPGPGPTNSPTSIESGSASHSVRGVIGVQLNSYD